MKRLFVAVLGFICALSVLTGCVKESNQDSTVNEKTVVVMNLLRGQTMVASDGSVLRLSDNGTYVWYQNDEERDDNYYMGNYKIYMGEEAVEILDGMSEYGFTAQEQYDFIARNSDKGITLNDWYVMEQTRTYSLVDGQETKENTRIVYAGVYYKDQKTYDAVNCNSANYAMFTVQ